MKRGLLGFLLATSFAYGDILKVEINGIIDPITAEFIAQAVEQAEEQNAEVLLIRLATPGGLGVSMQQIIQKVLNSNVPVVCYVGPKGAHAASAGFFILLSADVAAMAPGTNTGAAHPVFPFGMENEIILEKVKNAALASLRSIVNQRKRNYELAEKGVLESKSYTEQEALQGGLIDLVAADEQDLLDKLEGREIIRFTGEKQRISVRGQKVELFEMTLRQRILSSIADPNLALILGVIGLLGLYLEFTHPGLVLPGVVGGISLLLALMGFSLLPINYIAVLLILLALGLFVAEVTVQGFGILGIGGALALLFGILFLVDVPYPELRIQAGLAVAVVIPFALIFMFLLKLVIQSHKRKVTTGEEGLVGMIGKARTDVNEQGGKVFVHGALWDAVSLLPIPPGTSTRVVRVENFCLVVEPLGDSS